jgi:glycosyltransferase involved in cell wall biosynthesis
MHLAVDAHNLLSDTRGIGVYLREILRRFNVRDDLRLTLIVRAFWPARLRGEIDGEIGAGPYAIAAKVPRDADVIWHPWNGTFFRSNLPAAATIHDCVPFVFPAAEAKARAKQQEPFRASARYSARIITDSAFSRDQIRTYLGVAETRIATIPLAADVQFTPGQHARGRYLLFVGTDEPRKNFATLEAAWERREYRDVELVRARGLSFAQLRDAYRGALAVAVPSTYEGFGLPALEAMACGAPVIASRAASLPEVCGEAALYVDDPLSIEEWTAAIDRIASDDALRERLSNASIERAKQFSWDRCAEETLGVLRGVAR